MKPSILMIESDQNKWDKKGAPLMILALISSLTVAVSEVHLEISKIASSGNDVKS